MFEYMKRANQASQAGFVVLDTPVRVYETNYAYYKEKAWEEIPELPERFTAYLVDDTLAPWDMVKDTSGNDMPNIVYFHPNVNTHKVVMNGEEKDVTPVKYNFFNFPAEVEQPQEDGTVKPYKRKWLDGAYRAKIHFTKEIEAEVQSSKRKGEKVPMTNAKVDLPMGLWGKIKDALEATKSIKEDDKLTLQDCEVTFSYDGNASPGEKYTKITVKPLKKKIDIEAQLSEFAQEKKEFVIPDKPF